MKLPVSVAAVALLVPALTSSCAKKATEPLQTDCNAPWLPARIAEAQASGRGLDSVVEYQFRGAPVYVFSLGFAYDGDYPVYRCDGTLFCSLGGFAGNLRCDSVVFSTAATAPRTVWRR